MYEDGVSSALCSSVFVTQTAHSSVGSYAGTAADSTQALLPLRCCQSNHLSNHHPGGAPPPTVAVTAQRDRPGILTVPCVDLCRPSQWASRSSEASL